MYANIYDTEMTNAVQDKRNTKCPFTNNSYRIYAYKAPFINVNKRLYLKCYANYDSECDDSRKTKDLNCSAWLRGGLRSVVKFHYSKVIEECAKLFRRLTIFYHDYFEVHATR